MKSSRAPVLFATGILSLLLQLFAWSAEPPGLESIGNGRWPVFGRGPVLDAEIVGQYVYAVFGAGGLGIFDISDPGNIVAVGGGLSGRSFQIRVEGSRAYIAAESSGLQVFDVSNPRRTERLGYYQSDLAGHLMSVDVVGAYAYVGNDSGLEVLDVGTPTNIVRVSNYRTEATVWGLKVIGGRAYAAAGDAGLYVLDVSSPSQVTLLGRYDTNGLFFAVNVAGTTAYVAAHHAGLHILDVSDPAKIKRLGGYDTPGYSYDVSLNGSYAYVADEFAGVHVLDVGEPGNVKRVGGFDPRGLVYSVMNAGERTIVPDDAGSLTVLDSSNPTNLLALGRVDSSGGTLAIRVSGRYAFVADGPGGLQVLDVHNPTRIEQVGGYYTGGYAQNLDLDPTGSFVFMADGEQGLQVFDVRDRTRVARVGSYSGGGDVQTVHAVDGRVYITDYHAGFRIYDATHPTNLVLLGGLDEPFRIVNFRVAESRAYLIADMGADFPGLRVIDVSDPTNLVQLGTYPFFEFFNPRFQIVGRHLYLARFETGLEILDINDPANLVKIAGYPDIGPSSDVQLDHSRAYVRTQNEGVVVFDASNPTNLVRMGVVLPLTGEFGSICVDKNRIFVSEGFLGVSMHNSVRDLQFMMRVAASPGTSVTIESSTNMADLASWTSLFATNAPIEPFDFTDFDVRFLRKCYRVRQE